MPRSCSACASCASRRWTPPAVELPVERASDPPPLLLWRGSEPPPCLRRRSRPSTLDAPARVLRTMQCCAQCNAVHNATLPLSAAGAGVPTAWSTLGGHSQAAGCVRGGCSVWWGEGHDPCRQCVCSESAMRRCGGSGCYANHAQYAARRRMLASCAYSLVERQWDGV